MRPQLAILSLFLLGTASCTGVIYDPIDASHSDAAGNDAAFIVDGALRSDATVADAGAPGDAGPPDATADPCVGVTCGAHASCELGSCVCDEGYEGDPVGGCDPIATEEELARAELVNIAMAELGKCEGVDDEPYMLSQPGYWCYDFVAWVYQQSSWSLPAPYGLPQYDVGSFPAGWQPEPGDLIKFNIQHYGMVKAVSADGQTISTVEGNFNLCVASRNVHISSISYFGTLDNVFP